MEPRSYHALRVETRRGKVAGGDSYDYPAAARVEVRMDREISCRGGGNEAKEVE